MRFLTWNLENFFLHRADIIHLSSRIKDAKKTQEIADIILKLDPDIAFLTEIGGRETLRIFCETYLKNQYTFHLKRGNSARGIEIGYLLKKDFPYEIDHLGHANRPINFNYSHELELNHRLIQSGKSTRFPSHKMSRDISELRIYSTKDKKKKPKIIILGVHLKSKLDKEGVDWLGQNRRKAECDFLCEVYNCYKEKFGENTAIFITGDFNGNVSKNEHDLEFNSLRKNTDLCDFTEALNIENEELFSFIGFDKNKTSIKLQLDYFFVPKNFLRKINKKESGFYRFQNELGAPYPIPQSPHARFSMPSDHYPILVEISQLDEFIKSS